MNNIEKAKLIDGVTALAEVVHATAVEKGWWDKPSFFEIDPDDEYEPLTPEEIASKIALIHSELSEALEAVREDQLKMHLGENGKPEGMTTELADVFIRQLDLLERMGLTEDFVTALIAKVEYNKGRSYRHGGKKI